MSDKPPSGSQLEKLGDRLRDGPLTLSDLQQLRRFLETLEPFAEATFAKIRELDVTYPGLRAAEITRRNVKTTRSIVAKLRRQSSTLRQIQDLVGCRIVVNDIIDQNEWLRALELSFPDVQLIDRRLNPQHGYRAAHLIIRQGPRRFEVQVRTALQDTWANMVERIADRLGLDIKYGGGDPKIQEILTRIARDIATREAFDESWLVRFAQSTDFRNYGARIDAMPVVRVAGAPRPPGPRGRIVLLSDLRIPEGSIILIGKPGLPIKQASLEAELTVPAEAKKWISYNYQYDVVLDRKDETAERFMDTWEEMNFDLEDRIIGAMTLLEQFIQ